MHMTRPKSSKGRTRVRVTQAVDEGVQQSHMFSPHPPPPPASTVIPTHTVPRQSSRPSADVRPEIFERPPDVPVLSLNKYKVLPSIEKRPGDLSARGVEEKVSRLSLSDSSLRDHHQLQREQHISHFCSWTASKSDPEMEIVSTVQFDPNTGRVMPGHSESRTDVAVDGDAQLLLAIRTPCGQRFKWHFQPTDTLQAVVAAAEAESGERYEDAVIETMEVPRRTFTNLTMSLSQCGIFNKSVLCISLEDSTVDY
ncbi:UBX domain-containing protein 10 [Colossoma macropomum]|uniref:UBX domain-containing protein 10 n=1 Tax=Colossoma macropomum TaxID=42526 RepID=UPI00186507A5|nr:UBX domain-containing protein 10 [Colossoma macropomum]